MRVFWFVFLLILVFLLVRNADQVKRVLGSLSAAFTGNVVALQGGNPGAWLSSG